MLRRRPPRSTTCPSDPVGGPGRLRPERILRHAGDGAAAPAAFGRAIERTPPLRSCSGGVCLRADAHRGVRSTGVYSSVGPKPSGEPPPCRDAFVRSLRFGACRALPVSVRQCVGSKHARSLSMLVRNASDRSLLPTLPDGSGGSSRRGESAAFMAGAWRGSGLSLRPVALRALSFARGGHAAIRRGIFRASPCRPAGGCRPRPLRRRSCRPPRSPCPP